MIFLIRKKILFLVFSLIFFLKSSITPLLLLNFHFYFTITLQKKKREREALFLNQTSYIFLKFFVFVFNIIFLRV